MLSSFSVLMLYQREPFGLTALLQPLNGSILANNSPMEAARETDSARRHCLLRELVPKLAFHRKLMRDQKKAKPDVAALTDATAKSPPSSDITNGRVARRKTSATV
jgi:hypothetical protein